MGRGRAAEAGERHPARRNRALPETHNLELRAALSVARTFERAGALIALGRRPRPEFTSTRKVKDHDGIE